MPKSRKRKKAVKKAKRKKGSFGNGGSGMKSSLRNGAAMLLAAALSN